MKIPLEKFWSEEEVFAAGYPTISSENTVPANKLLIYLEKFKDDQLTTGTIEKYPNFYVQRDQLISVMRKKFPDHGLRQIISSTEARIPNFWETLFVMDFILHEIKNTSNMGYSQKQIAPGIYKYQKDLYSELRIVDNELIQTVSSPSPSSSNMQIETKQRAEIIMVNNTVYVSIRGGNQYPVTSLKTDGAPHRIMNYLLKRPDTLVTSAMLEVELETKNKNGPNLTETVRSFGFTQHLQPLKEIFFPGTTKGEIRLRSVTELNTSQIDLLKKHSERSRAKRLTCKTNENIGTQRS